jgi:hypothetical protein
MRRGWFSVFSTLAIGFVCLVAPLRAQFAYVTNESGNNVSAYSIGANGALTPVPGSPFLAGSLPVSVAPWIQRASLPTWQTRTATTSRPTASVPTEP